MIAVLIALILALAPANTEAPVANVVAVEAVQTAQEQALEASAWESLDLLGLPAESLSDTAVDYVKTVTVEDGPYKTEATEFAVVDPYDNVYIHIFKVSLLSHA